MRNGKCYSSSLLLLLSAALTVSSCRKENGIDNNRVVRTPYAVIYGERAGVLTASNDGVSYDDLILAPDNVAYRSVTATGDKGIAFIKTVFRYSTNNGLNFNTPPGHTPSNPIPAVNPSPKWASMMLDIPGDRLYVASTKASGVQWSANNGETWDDDDSDPAVSSAGIGSYALTTDRNLYGLNPNGTNIFKKVLPSNQNKWAAVTVATGLPSGSWYITNFNNTLVAADYTGASGIYSSPDGGANWNKYSGIPNNQEILSCAAPLGQVLLAGTDSAGIYRLTGGVFVPSNNGLEAFTSVYGITGKQDIYKNGTIKRYVYIATNKGLFRSEDLGQNWVLMKPGDIRAIW